MEELPPHLNPENVSGRGDLSDLETWLSGRMSTRLSGSLQKMSKEEYRVARSLVGDRYGELLGLHIEVADETSRTRDDDTSRSFRESGEKQRGLVSSVREARNTYRRYKEAKSSGAVKSARRLARDLDGEAAEAKGQAGKVREELVVISRNTGYNFSAALEALNLTIEEITRQRDTAVSNELMETETSVEAEESASFPRPATVEVTVTGENGSAVTRGQVEIRLKGGRTVLTKHVEEGFASATYRPLAERTGNHSLVADYTPPAESVYLGSSEEVPILVKGTPSTVDISSFTETTSFGVPVEVEGSVVAGGRAVPQAPVELHIGGVLTAENRTGGDGSFTVEGDLPAEVPPGDDVTLNVSVPWSDRAVSGSTASVETEVKASRTDLEISGRPEGASLVLSGGLKTLSGKDVPRASIHLSVAGNTVETVETGGDGGFETTVEVESNSGGNVTAVAVFPGSGNLLGSRAEVSVHLQGSEASAVDEKASDGWGHRHVERFGSKPITRIREAASRLPWLRYLVLGAVSLLLAAWGYHYRDRRRNRRDRSDGTGDSEMGEMWGDIWTESGGETVLVEEEPGKLDRARTLLEKDPEQGIRESYRVVRNRLTEEMEVEPFYTHREFLEAAARNGLSKDRVSALEQLTGTYETAAFAPSTPPREEAEKIVEVAETLLTSGDR